MKKYHICALGNALVDVEIEVSDDYLARMEVEKGVMCLVNEARQERLLQCVEGISHKRTCGGSAANTAIALTQLGGRAFLSCRVASDEVGDFYHADLLDQGVDSNLGGEREAGVTGKCLVFVTPDAERSMLTFLGATTEWGARELDVVALNSSEYLYIEGYLVANGKAKEALIQARQMARAAGVKTALTLSDPSLVTHFGDDLKEVIGEGVDLLFCNRGEALELTGKSDLSSAVKTLAERCPLVAVTLGPEGALIVSGGRENYVSTRQVKAVDTNGAGDLFAGAFLYALTEGKGPVWAARWACYASSTLVTHFGARLPKETLLGLWQDFLTEENAG